MTYHVPHANASGKAGELHDPSLFLLLAYETRKASTGKLMHMRAKSLIRH